MNKLLTTLALAFAVPLGCLVAPAHADEPTPPAPASCEDQLDATRAELGASRADTAYWKATDAVHLELYMSYRDAHEHAAGIAEQWQLVVVDQAETIERQRGRIDELEDGRYRLRARIADLRARLRAQR